jgi:hypothetical protein
MNYFVLNVFVWVVSWLCCFIRPVSATEASLTVAPAILEQITEPGKSNTTLVTVTNNTGFPLPIKSQVNAFISNTPFPSNLTETYNSASWFTLDPANFILQPKESKEVKVHIKPPRKTEPGGHYATIYFQPMIPESVVAPGSTLSLARIGVLTFLIVPGDIHENLTLSDFAARPWTAFGPIDFNFSLKNTGNIHLLPISQITITDMFGRIVGTLTSTPSTLLPGTTAAYTLTWEKSFLIGRYQAVATLNYGDHQTPVVSGPLIFWVFPWPIILIIIVLLTLINKIFIVHIDRVKLAIDILKGKDVKLQISQENLRQHPRSHSRTHTSDSTPPRSKRR